MGWLPSFQRSSLFWEQSKTQSWNTLGPALHYVTLTPPTPPSGTTDCSRVRPITNLQQSDLLPTNLKLEWRQTPCPRSAGPKPLSTLSPQSWLVPALSLAFQQLLGSYELSQGPSHKILFVNVRWFAGLITKRILKSTMTVTTSLSLWKELIAT